MHTSPSNYTLGANLNNVINLGAAAFSGIGNGLANRLSGGGGNDSLDGKAGDDMMAGGLGDDSYTVDSQTDVVTEASGGGTDTVAVKLTSYILGSQPRVTYWAEQGRLHADRQRCCGQLGYRQQWQ